ncbi:MAG: hypothetical protein QW512_05470 [Thermofilaceae archaeon]
MNGKVNEIMQMLGTLSVDELELLRRRIDELLHQARFSGLKIVCLPIENGAFKDVPVYCSHKRGHNWMATFTIDKNGLSRTFAPHAREAGYFYMVVHDWKLPAPVEFGADYYTNSGKRYPRRWYGVWIETRGDVAVFAEASSPGEALKLAEELKKLTPEKKESILVASVLLGQKQT